jgi:hypothetical protein
MTTAREYMRKYVIKYVNEFFDVLENKEFINDTKPELMRYLRKDPIDGLDWVLGEILNNYEFKKLGIVVHNDWTEDETTHETVYKIGKKYVRKSFKVMKYLEEPAIYEFVKPIRKWIAIETYEPIIKKSRTIKIETDAK